ncbi:cyclodeaminase/cyclohydrolase family protein [Paenibacillus sp. NEAU-GSW1]|uniref:cyclodeaminase/cyclohydrolase family protein n=1 Tax=Paenibacillus sp. NEAU-GSW1 TaxID=2682486 RepID=UPI0012E19B6C|nr:cyclodeaminase/cyclohydrolase family protein [Paenibacillus sp. NEAU-GSW1]MUT65728.1 methenyltetrahydrofolate cyclohydrolase [Paenibacillus sp. NEAU-GSW1]
MSQINWDQSIRHFIQQSASASPTPGGGSTAALAAALGSAMTSMVCNLTQGEKYAEAQPHMIETAKQMELTIRKCEELLAADIASFDTYMSVLKMPSLTEEGKLLRKQAIQLAAIRAIDVPLELMEVCKSGIEHASGIAESSNKNVISDLGIGAILFHSAAESALLTIRINLGSLKDAELKQQYADKAELLMKQITAIKTKTMAAVNDRLVN